MKVYERGGGASERLRRARLWVLVCAYVCVRTFVAKIQFHLRACRRYGKKEKIAQTSKPLRDTVGSRDTDTAGFYAGIEQNVRTLQRSDMISATVVKSHSIRTHIDLRFDHRMWSGCPQISTQGIFEYRSTKPYNLSSSKTNQPKVSVTTSTLQWTDGGLARGRREERPISLQRERPRHGK